MIRINIDGQEIKAYEGQTILEAAQANGIHIPTLCYDERVKIYGGCGLCVVEAEGNTKLLRACATQISAGMIIKTDTPRIRESRKTTLEFMLSDHSGDCRGPCVKACPAHTDVQGYVGLIANQQYEEALKLIKEKIPLPASIGRVCPHPCETACRRQLVEEPIAIAGLKHFAADIDLKKEKPYMPEIRPATGKKIAIIGAGPAGLTAAYYLAIEGHYIKIYDAMPQAGGMLRYGIPEYRLPKAILDQEIQLIEQMGVEFAYNTRIGTDISLEQLIKEYDAVFVGIGAWVSSEMRVTGEDLPGVIGGIDFLREVALYGEIQIGNTVAVVGGGNTAMDAARTALRLGAGKVMVLYRRTRAEMPAEEIEIIEAEEEGIEFRFLVEPLEILSRDGKACAIRLQKMELGEPDASGRRSPVPVPGAEEILEADTIISAIGQKVNPEGLDGLSLSRWGSIEADKDTLATNIPGVFAGGDGVTGPQIAIDAIAQGGRAAKSIHDYLNGRSASYQDKYLVERQGLTASDFDSCPATARSQMAHLNPEERRYNFREVNLGFTEANAGAEASRCLECGCKDYFTCKLIHYANTYKVQPQRLEGEKRQEQLQDKHPFIERNSEKCILCGLCVRVCDEVMGVTALGLVQRGFETMVQPEFNLPLQDTPCISCGQCVSVCPTGALMETYPVTKNLSLQMEVTPGVCSFCSTGCEPLFNHRGDIIYRVRPKNDGILCRQGRFAFEAFARDRITRPLIRRDGMLLETTWAEAIKKAGQYARSLKARYSGSALAAYISPAFTMEEAGAAASFARLALGTTNLGSFTPFSARGMAQVMGGIIPASSFAELPATDFILLAGSLNNSQVAAVKIRAAVKEGARLIIISPEETLVDDIASIKIRPGEDEDCLSDILAAVIKDDLAAKDYLERVSGYEKLIELLISKEPGDQARKVAAAYARAKKAMIVIDGNEVTPEGVELLTDLALITGHIGSPRNGIIVVTPGSNHMGLWNLGITGSDYDIKTGLKTGDLKGLFLFGEDPVRAGIINAAELNQLELVVVSTPYLTPTAKLAHVILPSSTPVETSGTYISADRTVKTLNRILKPQSGLENLDIINSLAASMKVTLTAEVREAITHSKQQLDFGQYRPLLTLPSGGRVFEKQPDPNPARLKFYEKYQF